MSRQIPLGLMDSSAGACSFISRHNREAMAAAEAHAQGQPDAPAFLWLWGAEGAGKSELLKASALLHGHDGSYWSLAPEKRSEPGRLHAFDGVAWLALDDVDAIAGQREWEVALYALYNRALITGQRIMFASETAPSRCPWILPDWQSRAVSAAVFAVLPMAEDELRQSLMAAARARGLELSDGVAGFILSRVPRTPSYLMGLLDHLDRASLSERKPLSRQFVQRVMGL